MTNIPTISFDNEADDGDMANGDGEVRRSVDSEELSIISLSCLFGDDPIRHHDDVIDDVELGDVEEAGQYTAL